MLQDFRYACRMLAKSPAFTIIAVLTLALGIGANSAIFSVIDAVLLRPLPFNAPNELAMVWNKAPAHGEQPVPLSYPDAVDLRQRNKSFSHLAIFTSVETVLEGADQSQLLQGLAATSDIFAALDFAPLLGSSYSRESDNANAPRVVLISHALWQNAFGSDPAIVGRQITLASRRVTVLGVLPAGWKFPVQNGRTDYLMPLEPLIPTEITHRGGHFLSIVGRLRSGITLQSANAELNAIAAQLAREYPDTNLGRSVVIIPAHEDMVGNVRPALLVLLGAVALVLLIACANVANLLLARAAVRRREMAIRAALGASRIRIIRQLLAESFLLALFGATGGLIVAWWGLDVLVALGPGDLPRANEIAINPLVGAFTFCVAIFSTLLFGLLPSLELARCDVSAALQQGAKGSTSGFHSNRLRGLLIISQVALSLLLLIGAGLLLKTFANLRATNPGFDPSHVMTANFVLNSANYPEPDEQLRFYDQFIAKLRALPGVESVGAIAPLPFSGNTRGLTFTIAGEAPIAPGDHPGANYAMVERDYFATMRIPILRGRAFNEHDSAQSQPVAVVNAAFARKHFPNGNAVGQTLVVDRGGGKTIARPVVGVIGDSRHETLGIEAVPEIYVPFAQDPQPPLDLVLRTGMTNFNGLNAAIRDAVQQIDRGVFVPQLAPMESLVAASLAQPRFNMTLLGIFASLATILATIGIYGVIGYNVAQRTKEIGIRMALGAQREEMLRMILGQSMRLVLIGVVVGTGTALLAARVISNLLYGVGPNDLSTYFLVVLLLAVAALIASYIPARRAMAVDPMIALRYE
ncbi:MAG TPA: ABC transporter permease [Chthoniobacterales bacterium]